MKLTAFEDLFLQQLGEMYDAEQRILKALPKMAKAASRSELKAAFETHTKQTKNHQERLERIYKAFGEEPKAITCEPVRSLIEQGEKVIDASPADPSVLDAALITIAQRVEHYEISSYGSLRTHAETLGYSKIADLLETTLNEEEKTDKLLTEIAESRVNREAVNAPYAKARTAPRMGQAEGGGGLGGLIFGLAIGAAVALLYAPKSGQETRDDLNTKANEGADYLRRRGEEVRHSANELLERGRRVVNEQRDRVAEVVDAGKDRINDLT